jgi:release factor glutamine methyltransferase
VNEYPERAFEREISWLIKAKYSGNAKADLTDDLRRLKSGEPIDYVIGWSDFLGCQIGLLGRPLIPRAETEYWTRQVITQINQRPGESRCLDIFAGSGCIGIAILKHCPRASVDFIEQEAKFCDLIGRNCAQNDLQKTRYRITRGDVFSGADQKIEYDFILANPPYVPSARAGELDSSVIDWEPAEALFAGTEGLSVIERFLAEAKRHLSPGGQLWLEYDSGQQQKISRLARANGFSRCDLFDDQFGQSRWAVIS